MPTRTTSHFVLSTFTLSAALLAACSGSAPSRPVSEQKPAPGTSAHDAEAQRRIDDMRLAMQSPSGGGGAPTNTQPRNDSLTAPATESAWTPDEHTDRDAIGGGMGEPTADITLDGAAPPIEPVRAASVDQRISAASQELAAALRERSEREPARAAEALTAMASLSISEPGVSTAYLPDDASLARSLTPAEAATVRSWLEISRQLPAVLASGDAGRGVAELLRAGADSIDSPALGITTATLCDRVDGFGIYRELHRDDNRHKLIAGRANKAIVYVELDGFAFRASSRDGAPGHLIELTQDFSLYESGGGVLAWRMPEQDITDFSRNQRRDFYVLQVIELPAALSVGAYELKISLRDRNTDAIAEHIIPIDVVADASALRGK